MNEWILGTNKNGRFWLKQINDLEYFVINESNKTDIEILTKDMLLSADIKIVGDLYSNEVEEAEVIFYNYNQIYKYICYVELIKEDKTSFKNFIFVNARHSEEVRKKLWDYYCDRYWSINILEIEVANIITSI
jgi:hypothetical protein